MRSVVPCPSHFRRFTDAYELGLHHLVFITLLAHSPPIGRSGGPNRDGKATGFTTPNLAQELKHGKVTVESATPPAW
jgi:hypothetical protein